MKNRIIRGLIVGIAVFIITLILYYLNLFCVLEWKSWDLRLHLFSHPSQASDDIVLFLIDQESLDVYERGQGVSWPWPREMYSYIIQYCMKGKVKALLIDFIFSESSVYGVEDDLSLAEAMAQSENIFLPIFLSHEEKESEEAALHLLKRFSFSEKNLSPEAEFQMKSVSLPIEPFLSSVFGVGNVNFASDKDGIYRRIPLLFTLDNLILPSLPLAIVNFIKEEQKFPCVPLDDSGQMIINYHGPTGTYPSYSIAAIINSFALMEQGKIPQIPPDEFAGKIVLVGGSAPGILDLRPTPLSAVCPGVEIQAIVIDNLLNEDFIRVPSKFLFFLFLGIFSLLTGLGMSLFKKIWTIILFIFFCIALPACAACLAFLSGYWLEFVAPEFAVLLSIVTATLLNYSFEGRQRRFIKRVFRHYLNPHVIERLIKNPSMLQLGGEKRDISSFFSDVAGFTSISESLSPEDLVNLLNAYLSEMTDIILSSGGTLDKYEGDAIIAFWNAPLDQPDHALRACRAALRCQRRLEELRPGFHEQFGHELYIRIGINSGPAVVGNMGSHNRFDYTAMGDTINLASRLEGVCKLYKVPILIGEATHEKVKNTIVSREVDFIRVVGKKKPVRVFEAIGEKNEVTSSRLEKIEIFQQALNSYRSRQWEKAQSLFQKLGDDKLAEIYIERLQHLRESPPPKEWSGVYDLREK